MKPGFRVVCLEPGADNPNEPPPDPEPPEGFVDNTVYRYRIDEDGNKVLIGTMDAFPEGWHRSKTDWEKGFQKQSKEDEEMARYDWKALWPQAQELLAQGLSTAKVAEKLGIDAPALRCKIDRERRKAEKQTPTPEPEKVGRQDPVQENVESATEIIPELEYLKQTGKEEEYGCPFDEPAYNPNPPEDNDFTAEDDEPIPYTVTDFADHHKIALEIAELLDQKRADYGTENIKKFGSHGVLVRVSDKVERLINLSKRNNKPNFESVEDTWRDIAGYAILALIELREGR